MSERCSLMRVQPSGLRIPGLGGVFEERSAGLFFPFFFSFSKNADGFEIANTDLVRWDGPYLYEVPYFYWL